MNYNAECGIGNAEFKQKTLPEKSALNVPAHNVFVPNSAFRIPHSKGFTLLEVMVAVSIMSFTLVTLLGLQSRSSADVKLAEHITTATMLAKRKMVDTIAVTKKLQPIEEDGDFSDENNFEEYTWKRTISIIPVSDTVFITEIRVAVLWSEGSRQESVELVDYE